MARRNSNSGQGELIPTPRHRPGRVERAVDTAIRRRGGREDHDAGVESQARELARVLDHSARVKVDPYAVAAVSRELREVLAALKMTPAARQAVSAGGQLEQLLESLGPSTTEEQP